MIVDYIFKSGEWRFIRMWTFIGINTIPVYFHPGNHPESFPRVHQHCQSSQHIRQWSRPWKPWNKMNRIIEWRVLKDKLKVTDIIKTISQPMQSSSVQILCRMEISCHLRSLMKMYKIMNAKLTQMQHILLNKYKLCISRMYVWFPEIYITWLQAHRACPDFHTE